MKLGKLHWPKWNRRQWIRNLLVGLVVFFLLYQLSFMARILWYQYFNPGASSFMRATIKELRAEDPTASIVHEWVDYDQISPNLARAVIASEDSNFLYHNGVEWDAIRDAWAYNRAQASQGSPRRRGGSTITQQLAKNLFLSPKRSYIRKAQELLLAYMLELMLSKKRIIELYLNVAQWSNRHFGAQAAARRYFNTGASNLTAQQAAQLAVTLPNPRYYDTHGATPYLRQRTQTIAQRMRLVETP
ncbi:MAG TPA: monofunctional biosynthetic peptidoglycan transglycosylase [Paenalcaligenes sp.]|nr:monofunctional biosynthetic peptidoglycan transglycosylase [Paenalcaligenes sp.]